MRAAMIPFVLLWSPLWGDVLYENQDVTIDSFHDSFTMDGGTLTILDGAFVDGGVTLDFDVEAYMSGGLINGNVGIIGYSTLHLSGGLIVGNISGTSRGSLQMTGGTIDGDVMNIEGAVDISGGVITGSVWNERLRTISGGTIVGDVYTFSVTNHDLTTISGGTIGGDLIADNLQLVLSGGSIGGSLIIDDRAVGSTMFAPIIRGRDLRYTPFDDFSGVITGYLLDGTSLGDGLHYEHRAGIAPHLVPEPSSLVLLCLGVAGLALLRRNTRVSVNRGPLGLPRVKCSHDGLVACDSSPTRGYDAIVAGRR